MSEDVKYCRNCGQQLAAAAQYCDRCGKGQSADEATPAPKSTDEQPYAEGATDTTEESGLSRRQTIVGGAVGLVAGITGVTVLTGAVPGSMFGSGADREELPTSGWDERETRTEDGVEILEGAFTLAEGEYTGATFTASLATPLGLRYEASDEIVVAMIRLGEQDAFADGETVSTLRRFSDTDTTGNDVEGELPAGDWVLMFDNSSQYGTSPDGSVDCEFAAGIR